MPSDRPDLCARVFKLKLDALIDIQIVEEGLLSTIKASKVHGLFLIIPFSCSNIMLTLTLK